MDFFDWSEAGDASQWGRIAGELGEEGRITALLQCPDDTLEEACRLIRSPNRRLADSAAHLLTEVGLAAADAEAWDESLWLKRLIEVSLNTQQVTRAKDAASALHRCVGKIVIATLEQNGWSPDEINKSSERVVEELFLTSKHVGLSPLPGLLCLTVLRVANLQSPKGALTANLLGLIECRMYEQVGFHRDATECLEWVLPRLVDLRQAATFSDELEVGRRILDLCQTLLRQFYFRESRSLFEGSGLPDQLNGWLDEIVEKSLDVVGAGEGPDAAEAAEFVFHAASTATECKEWTRSLWFKRLLERVPSGGIDFPRRFTRFAQPHLERELNAAFDRRGRSLEETQTEGLGLVGELLVDGCRDSESPIPALLFMTYARWAQVWTNQPAETCCLYAFVEGHYYRQAQLVDDAVETFEWAAQRFAASANTFDSDVKTDLVRRCRQAGDAVLGCGLGERALRIYDDVSKHLPSEDEQLAEVRLAISEIHLKSGRTRDAYAAIKEAQLV